MEARMSKAQRVVLMVGSICILHSSMVPPVAQGEDYVCRYHEFVERHWPFTRGYDVANADLVALLSEFGLIIAVTAVAYHALGLTRRD